jgi:aminoglycoside/choline kinase family phosphotransferase
MVETSEAKTQLLDAFKDRLSQRARDTSRPALAHQSRGRALTEDERILAEAMMTIMSSKVSDFAAVADALKMRGVRAPISGRTDWDLALLEAELTALNADFEAQYAEHGYGA